MKFLYRRFIRDYQNVKDSKVRVRYGMFAGIVGVISNFFLVIFKFVIGILVNSISLIGDSLNNLGDALSSFINIFSFKINNKPADKEHPYGHRRSEYVGSFMISILIIVVAIELFISSVDKIISPRVTDVSWYLLLVLIINVVIKSFMAVLYRDSSKTINSLSLKASYKDSLNDIITTLIVVIGLYLSMYLNFDLDGYLGIGLSIFIAISAIKLIKESIDKLLGESLKDEVLNEIVKFIEKDKDIISLHDVLTHQYGEGKVFMSLHVEMDASYSLLQAHDIVDRLERKVKNNYNVELLIHVDPIDFNNEELKRVKLLVTSILNQVDSNLSSYDLRIVKGKEKRLYFDLVMPYSYEVKSKELVDIVIEEISRTSDYKTSIEIHYK